MILLQSLEYLEEAIRQFFDARPVVGSKHETSGAGVNASITTGLLGASSAFFQNINEDKKEVYIALDRLKSVSYQAIDLLEANAGIVPKQ